MVVVYYYTRVGVEIYESDICKVVGQGFIEQSYFGEEYQLYIENTGDEGIYISIDDVSVNGKMIDPLLSVRVLPGCVAVDTITFFEDDLEEQGITDFEKMELVIEVGDAESWWPIEESDTIELTF